MGDTFSKVSSKSKLLKNKSSLQHSAAEINSASVLLVAMCGCFLLFQLMGPPL